LVVKDIQTFAREPAQWGQSAVIFGLLFLYMSNLRRIVVDGGDGFWSVLTSYLNLLVCTLALSTLTTRFVFPQVSIEGQRIWMLGLAPVKLEKILSVKLWLATVTTGVMTSFLTALSCWTLQVPLDRTIFFLVAVCLMAFGLNALALGLGTLFPNFKETNPARVVSGFGGTICLIASFVYLALSMVAVMLPALSELSQRFSMAELIPWEWRLALAIVALVLLTAAFGWVPYIVAKKRIKNLDYFRSM
jgi:ABC-2 type transport system permease protein